MNIGWGLGCKQGPSSIRPGPRSPLTRRANSQAKLGQSVGQNGPIRSPPNLINSKPTCSAGEWLVN